MFYVLSYRRVCRITHCCGWLKILGHDLRAALTGSLAFLLPPLALRSNGAGREGIDHCRDPADRFFNQTTPRGFRRKMPASATGARRRNTEHLAGSYRSGKLQ
jgi:hypothetical protein